MNNKKLLITSLLLVTFAFLPMRQATAASFNLPVTADTVKAGDKFSASIKIDTQSANINAAQVTLKFPANLLQVSSFDKTSSVFSFWLQDPVFSNTDGTLSFIAGSTSGFSGPSLQILTVNFTAIANGIADLSFANAAITAGDGSGTNIVSSLNGAKVTITSAAVTPAPVVAAIPAPVQIQRPVTPAGVLPIKPVLTIPLYPDPMLWYNLSSIFLVSWALPVDVSEVATALDKNPATNPSTSEGLFNNKTFPAVDNGVWYLHVRFKNNIGWGPTVHHRLAIDTVPPVAFDLKFSEGLSTDNPAPTVTFNTGDQLSGIANYYIKIDGTDRIVIKGSPYTLPVLKPGKHLITVGAQDNAGNSTEDVATLEILPIQSPTIISTSTNIFTGEGGLTINGQSLPSLSVILTIKDHKGNLVSSFTAQADASGNWAAKFDTPLKNGTYYVEATAQDSRGALSLPTKSPLINVSERPVITILGLGITQSGLIAVLIIILLGAFLSGWYFNMLINKQRDRKIIVSQRDVGAAFGIIRADISKGVKMWSDKKIDEREITELEFLLKHASENLDKLEKYIISGIKDIGSSKSNL